MKPHYFVSDSSGDLFDTRSPNWSLRKPLRQPFARHFREFTGKPVEQLAQIKATIRAGEFTFPGCYRLAIVTQDGGTLCFDCCRKEFLQIADETLRDYSAGFRPAGILGEHDTESCCTCDHCKREIWTGSEEG